MQPEQPCGKREKSEVERKVGIEKKGERRLACRSSNRADHAKGKEETLPTSAKNGKGPWAKNAAREASCSDRKDLSSHSLRQGPQVQCARNARKTPWEEFGERGEQKPCGKNALTACTKGHPLSHVAKGKIPKGRNPKNPWLGIVARRRSTVLREKPHPGTETRIRKKRAVANSSGRFSPKGRGGKI